MEEEGKSKTLCIFDLDGTLTLTDTRLTQSIIEMSKKGIVFVAATGRTNSYVKEAYEKNNIIPPRYIIADNGGSIYDTLAEKYIKRTLLRQGVRETILKKYLMLGGRLEELRYTDGENVYVAETDEVRKYYEKEEAIEYKSKEELAEAVLDGNVDITKITLAGNRGLIKRIMSDISEEQIQCWSDIGATRFPIRLRENYRLDITDKETSKGEAVKFLVEQTGISRFVCIGNGLNDLSMFKFALDSGMPIIVVQNYENGRLTKESQKIVKLVKDYAKSIGIEESKLEDSTSRMVTITDFPINMLISSVEKAADDAEKMKKRLERMASLDYKQRRKNFEDGIKHKKDIKLPKQIDKNSNIVRRVQNRGEK